MADFDLNDPSTFQVSSPLGVMKRNYSYQVTVTTYVNDLPNTSYVTVNSNELLSADRIGEIAMAYGKAGGPSGQNINEDSILAITGAKRSSALG